MFFPPPTRHQWISDHLPSSPQVLSWGGGDSFDFATLLCSFLLGAGYDAYVVYGYAPKYITERDQTCSVCPDLRREEEEEEAAREAGNATTTTTTSKSHYKTKGKGTEDEKKEEGGEGGDEPYQRKRRGVPGECVVCVI